MTIYPAQIDNSTSLPEVIDNATPIRAEVANNLRAAIIAIEDELGIQPSGIYGTIRSRFDALESTVGNLKIISLAGDLGNTLTLPHVIGIQGIPVSSATPTTGQLFAYLGNAWGPVDPPPSVGGFTAAGDLSGNNVSQTVVGLQNIPVTTTEPTNDQVLTFNGTHWGPADPSGGGAFVPSVEHINASYVCESNDYLISVENITTPITITLEPGAAAGKILVVKDANGNASTKNITVNTSDGSLIDGQSTFLIGVNYDKATFGFNGTNWEIIVSSAVPLTIVLPIEMSFVAADQTAATSTPTRAGSRTIDLIHYPATTVDGRVRQITFNATIETSNGSAVASVQLKNINDNTVVSGTTLTTSSTNPIELTAVPSIGTEAGTIRTDTADLYDVQIFLTGGNVGDVVTCSNARIIISYSNPIIVSTVAPPQLPTEIALVAGTIISNSSTLTMISSRKIDLSLFPATLPDGRVRNLTFYVDAETSTVGTSTTVALYNATDGYYVTGTTFNTTSVVATEYSAALTAGVVNGNIRTDAAKQYEMRMALTSGGPSDRAICNNARIVITYS